MALPGPRSAWTDAAFLTALLLMAAHASMIPGCFEKSSPSQTYTDDMGDTIELRYEPASIVTLSPGLTEIVFFLGMGERISGCDGASNYPPEAKEVLKVSSWQGVELEKLVALDPDLVLMDRTLDFSSETYDQIMGAGIPVYRIYPRSIEDVLENIEDIGTILGVGEEALRLVEGLRSRMDAVISASSGTGGAERPKVLHISYYDGSSDPWTATSSTFSGDMIELAGGRNVVDDDKGIFVQVPVERIISEDPDLIVTSQSGTWPTTSRSIVQTDPAWRDISAVKSGQVHDIEGDLVDRTGPRCIDGLEELHRLVMNATGA